MLLVSNHFKGERWVAPPLTLFTLLMCDQPTKQNKMLAVSCAAQLIELQSPYSVCDLQLNIT